MTMMIYTTPINEANEPTDVSTDSGMTSLDEVVMMMGDTFTTKSDKHVTYGDMGIAFTTYKVA